MKDSRHRIFDDLEKLNRLKVERQRVLPGRICPIYTPAQDCVGSKCLWFDLSDMECWILNPKPKRVPE